MIGKEFKLTRVRDRNGNELRLLYQGGLLSKIENEHHGVVFSRTKTGRVYLVQDDTGRQVGYKYDNYSRLVEADDRGGNVWKYSYFAEGRLHTATDPLQRLNFSVGFDEQGRVHSLQLPSGVIQYRYEPGTRSTTVTDRRQLTSRFFQNEEGITTRVVNALGEETAITLDAFHNVTALTRNGAVIESLRYDQRHQLLFRRSTGTTAPVEKNYSYDPGTGHLLGIESSTGVAVKFAYDGNGNPSTAVLPGGTLKFAFERGALGLFATDSTTLKLRPNADGLIGSVSQDNSAPTEFWYEAGGELNEMDLPSSMRIEYKYQLSGLRSKMEYKDGRRVEYSYDPAGNLTATKVFNRKGAQINGQLLEMNESYQLIHWVLFDGTTTTLEYDPNGNLTVIKKGKEVTKFEYDALDRLIAVATPNNQHLAYSYSPGERSLIEQYEHANVNIADLRDTGLTFAGPFNTIASRPLNAAFGAVRFSETLGTFQLANADGSEVVLPNDPIEGALAKLHIYQAGMSQKALQSGFSAPFNIMFVPAEYLTINCCPECYYDGEEWYCPPCSGGGGNGLPDHLEVISDITQPLEGTCPVNTNCKERDVTYAVVDIDENPIPETFAFAETFDSMSANGCGNGDGPISNCGPDNSGIGGFTDLLTVGCNTVGGSCGETRTNQRWFICDLIFNQPIGSPGTVVVHNDGILIGGLPFFVPGTDIFP